MVPWLLAAFNELDIGVKEVPGPLSNERIAEYLKSVGQPGDDSIPWCSAFVNHCLKQGGMGGTGSARARSFLNWGVPASDPPRVGSITVFWRGIDPSSGAGHVGFLIHQDTWLVTVLGGNQSDAVTIARYPRSQLLGFRWPE